MFFFIEFINSGELTVAKAFSKSIKVINVFLFTFSLLSVSTLKAEIASLVPTVLLFYWANNKLCMCNCSALHLDSKVQLINIFQIDMSRPCSIYDPSSIIEQCEELISLKNSNLNFHSFYVTSNHSVLTLDNRMGFVHKAYHMLSTPPSLITSHCYENR